MREPAGRPSVASIGLPESFDAGPLVDASILVLDQLAVSFAEVGAIETARAVGEAAALARDERARIASTAGKAGEAT